MNDSQPQVVTIHDPERPFISESLADLSRNPPPPASFLLSGYWPSDAYGVVAAQAKAGKTWIALDIGLAVATGGMAFGSIPVHTPGPVLVLLGEGGRRNALRRLRALCAHYSIKPEEVHDLRLIYKAPRLSNADHVVYVEAAIEHAKPVLVIVDPLYLAASGADGASLYGMAAVLEQLRTLAADAHAAMIVVHHFNKTGHGKGPGRMSGAGPEEWGRVLWSVAVESRAPSEHPGGSVVNLSVSVRGGEVPDGSFGLTREVWVDDPDDLNSAMHYRVDMSGFTVGDADGAKPPNGVDRTLNALKAAGGWADKHTVQNHDAEWAKTANCRPLKADTVGRKLGELHQEGKVERRGSKAGGYSFRIPSDEPTKHGVGMHGSD